jgi:hypothetical protein
LALMAKGIQTRGAARRKFTKGSPFARQTCYNCGDPWHFVKDFPKPKRLNFEVRSEEPYKPSKPYYNEGKPYRSDSRARAFIGEEYTSDDESTKEKVVGVAGLASLIINKPATLFNYDLIEEKKKRQHRYLMASEVKVLDTSLLPSPSYSS